MAHEAGAVDCLERMLLDVNAEPIAVPLSLLETITNNFSDDHIIGSGGFAKVYKGELQNGALIAVKKLSNTLAMDDEKFIREVGCHIKVRHKNIVRFLGYYGHTQLKVENYKGKAVKAEVGRWLLCFEFLPKGSLDRGYMAPEFLHGEITFKSDIYSLGAIIIEILTGQKAPRVVEKVLESWSNRFKKSQADTQLGQARVCADISIACLDANPANRPAIECIIEALDKMEMKDDSTGIGVCASSVALLQRITSVPNRWETRYKMCSLGSTEISKLLDVHPLEIYFPFKPNRFIHCPVNLTNKTHQYVGFWISLTNQDAFLNLSFPSFEIVEPHSSLAIAMTAKQPKPPLRKTCMFKVWMIVMSSRAYLERLKEDVATGDLERMTSGELKGIEKWGAKVGVEVHRVILKSVICDPASCQPVIHNRKFIPAQRFVLGNISCIDVHPTETWILVGCEQRFACIWNYKTKERVMVWQLVSKKSGMPADLFKWSTNVTSMITSAKFIVRESWSATGDDDGWVHVYAYPANDKVKEFKAHDGKPVDSLAVHPAYPFLVTSSSKDTSIKLWDWGQGWICIRTFNEDRVSHPMWSQTDNNTFISASSSRIKTWDIHLSDHIIMLKGTKSACYLCTGSNQHLMVTIATDDHSASIWDLQRKECLHQLGQSEDWYSVYDIACHPTLPVLLFVIAHKWSTKHCYIYLWDARTYRIEEIIQLPEVPQGKVFITDTENLTSNH